MPAHTLSSAQSAAQSASAAQASRETPSPDATVLGAPTPGPWFPVWNGHYWDINTGADLYDPSLGVAWHTETFADVAKANAHLIAAAPDLLAALRRAEVQLRMLMPDDVTERGNVALKIVAAAIAKAEGRS